MKYIKLGKNKIGTTGSSIIILSVCLLFLIGSFIFSTKTMIQSASAQQPDTHLYTPHTGIIHQIPDRVTLVPAQPNR
jgi:hypothetical protein